MLFTILVMRKFIDRLINGENIYQTLSFEELTYLLKAICMTARTPGANKTAKWLYDPNVAKFMFSCSREQLLFKTPDVDVEINTMSYKEVKQEIKRLLPVMNIDMINSDSINRYNQLARRNNAIIQVLIDLSGEFHAYHDGILVERIKEL